MGNSQVNVFTRRIFTLFAVLSALAIVLLAPWAVAPSRSDHPAFVPESEKETASQPPAPKGEPATISVAVGMAENEFAQLAERSVEWAADHDEIIVKLERLEPSAAHSAFVRDSKLGEAADVMLVDNEWAMEFATAGYLLPADAAFIGEALAEQFDALISPLKWNGLVWAVPYDFDPYVRVWNRDLLKGDTIAAAIPANPGEWEALMARSRQSAGRWAWLAADGSDPFALLAWLETATGARSDVWMLTESDLRREAGSEGRSAKKPAEGTALDTAKIADWTSAIATLYRERAGILFAGSPAEVAEALLAGKVALGLLPHSEAMKLLKRSEAGEGTAKLDVDRSGWNVPFVWPRGRSFALFSGTKVAEAARKWIAGMTRAAAHSENERETGKLPVYRSLFAPGTSLHKQLAGAMTAQSAFPNRPPAAADPALPARLAALSSLWKELNDGANERRESVPFDIKRWRSLWPVLSSSPDLERDD